MNWIDFSKVANTKYRKKLIQPLEAKPFAIRLEEYFDDHDTYNIYNLSLYLGMSVKRFEHNYLKSDDKQVALLARMAMDAIAGEALANPEKYAKSLKFILARANTGRDFIELSEDVKDNSNQVIILPSKN